MQVKTLSVQRYPPLSLNAINSIEAFTSDAFTADVKEEDGRIEFRLEQDKPSDDTTLLLKSLILGLQGIENEEENMQYIDVIFEEV